MVTRAIFPLLAALALGCGAATPSASGSQAAAQADDGPPLCEPVVEVTHPSHTSETLRLELVERHLRSDIPQLLPPLSFEVEVTEELGGPIEMELTVYDPKGQTHTQRFAHMNMREQCDPICDRAIGGGPCPPPRCWMERFRPGDERLDRSIYRGSMPGQWTFVLRRLDSDERVSVTRRLFEGESLDGEDCEALPTELGGFRRVSCRRGIVPTGSRTNHWGLKAQYERRGCRANAFALPLSYAGRALFDEGPYRRAPEHEFPEGTVHQLDVDGFLVRAWLAHHHSYIFAGHEALPAYDRLVRAMLSVFPVVDGPVRELPTCEATGDVVEQRMAPATRAQLSAGSPSVLTHFEGNRPSGVRLRAHRGHPLMLTGIRHGEILHAVDGVAVPNRQAFEPVLTRLTRPGELELLVSREELRHPRCIRLRVAVASPPPPPPPPPQVQPPAAGPRRGRHCERRTGRCWDCVEFPFPAAVGCERRCPRDALCVEQGGAAQCLPSTRVCCAEGQSCNRPPGCEGAASSCASGRRAGRNERCTFLSACATPLPGGG